MAKDLITLTIAEAEDLVLRAFTAIGVRPESALAVARALVAAEAEGQVGHGFSRIADYAAQARSGKVRGDALPRIAQATGASAVIDAGHGFAYPALDLAISWGIETARRDGVAAMSVTRSHHCGALSLQVEKFAEAGMIGLMVANAPAAIAPWGSSVPVFGTNPIAFAAPRREGPPLVIDLSLSRVARGKVMHARKSGAAIPEGWALDADGQPTTDPEAALAGSMIAIGEAKGTALALMVEILAATFTGANPSREVSSFFTDHGPPPGSGQFLMALKPGNGFADRIEALLDGIEALEGTRLPGTRRAEAIKEACRRGIDIPGGYVRQVRDLAAGP